MSRISSRISRLRLLSSSMLMYSSVSSMYSPALSHTRALARSLTVYESSTQWAALDQQPTVSSREASAETCLSTTIPTKRRDRDLKKEVVQRLSNAAS